MGFEVMREKYIINLMESNNTNFFHSVVKVIHTCIDCSCHIFFQSGKYIKQAQVVRARSQLEHLQSEIASVARRTGISSATKLALIAPSADQGEDIPVVEWWDVAILPNKRLE